MSIMNKFLILLAICFSLPIQAQLEWEINETDEFTGHRKLVGKWERINPLSGNYTYVRFGMVKDLIFLDFKNCLNKVVSVDQGDKVYFKFENEE